MMKNLKYSSNEFTISNLPSTRKALFFDILKHKYKFVLLLGLVIFLFLIPAFAANISFDLFLNKISQDPNLVNGEVITDAGMQVYRSAIIVFASCHVFTSIIAFVGLSGVMRVIRLLCWNEGLLFWDDFWIGVRQNIKQFIVFSIIYSLGTVLIYLSRIVSSPIFYGLSYGLTFAIINPLVIAILCYASTYSLKVGKILRNGFALYIKNFFLLLLFSLFTVLYYLLNYIPIPLVMYLVKLLVIVFLMPIFMIAVYLSFSNIFDKLINKTAHPELMNKGLYKVETKDEESI